MKLQIDSNSPLERVKQRFEQTDTTIFYGLRRRAELVRIARFVAARQYSCPYVSEMQVEIGTLLLGKVYFMKTLMWLRCHDGAPISHQGFDRGNFVFNWLSDSAMKSEHDLFINSLRDFICTATSDNLTPEMILENYTSSERKHLNIGNWRESIIHRIGRNIREIAKLIWTGERWLALFIVLNKVHDFLLFNSLKRGYLSLQLTIAEMRYAFGIRVHQDELHHAMSMILPRKKVVDRH